MVSTACVVRISTTVESQPDGLQLRRGVRICIILWLEVLLKGISICIRFAWGLNWTCMQLMRHKAAQRGELARTDKAPVSIKRTEHTGLL